MTKVPTDKTAHSNTVSLIASGLGPDPLSISLIAGIYTAF